MAGDSTLPAAVEHLTPFVIEAADLGPLWTVDARFTDAQRIAFVLGDGAPLPTPVPLDGSGLFLATALICALALKVQWGKL